MPPVGRPPSGGCDGGQRLGRVLLQRRTHDGITRDQAAHKAALSPNTVMAIEQGRVADPGFFAVTSLAGALGFPLDELLGAVRAARSRDGVAMSRGLISMGYEDRQVDSLVADLRSRGVTVLVDVRLNAVSRRRGFSKRALAAALAAASIDYRHFRALGNPKENRSGFHSEDSSHGQAVFRELLNEDHASEQLNQLVALASDAVVAILCFERDESNCHRKVIVDAVRERRANLPVVAV